MKCPKNSITISVDKKGFYDKKFFMIFMYQKVLLFIFTHSQSKHCCELAFKKKSIFEKVIIM